jgi:hypothetical protein
MVPRMGPRLLEAFYAILRLDEKSVSRAVLVNLLVGELLPEYKFRFVFQGLWNDAVARGTRGLGQPSAAAPVTVPLEERMKKMRQRIHPRYMPFHLAFLTRFLEDLRAAGIQVVIVEGGYNPVAQSQEMAETARLARSSLQAIAEAFPEVRFVTREEIEGFSESDYYDLTHVTDDAGEPAARRILERLERS